MSCKNFRIIIQAVIKSFGRSTDKWIEENSNEAFRYYLYNIVRGTQRMVSVNYLFGGPLIPSDFLKRIVTLNFRDMRNLMSVVLGS